MNLIALQSLKQKSQKRKTIWMRGIHIGRVQKGEFHLLVLEIALFGREYLLKYFQMTPSTKEQLLL